VTIRLVVPTADAELDSISSVIFPVREVTNAKARKHDVGFQHRFIG
jgi:hypothetical protein